MRAIVSEAALEGQRMGQPAIAERKRLEAEPEPPENDPEARQIAVLTWPALGILPGFAQKPQIQVVLEVQS
jgi:hypothetical protein